MVRRILMIIAPQNFRDEELFIPKSLFEDAGFQVTVSSIHKGIIKGMLGKTIYVEKLISELNGNEYEALVLVGGSGVEQFKVYEYPEILNLVRAYNSDNKIIAAICLAPMILAKAGILKDKQATVWESASHFLQQRGAKLSEEQVVKDGKIITANGPEASEEFGRKILELLG